MITGHPFVGVAGHPDDDECTHRADGTDASYCGAPAVDHAGERRPDGYDIVAVPTTADGLMAIAEAINRLAAAVENAGLPAAVPAPAKPQRQSVRVDGLTPDDVGIIAVRHNLGADRVAVRLFAPDGTRVVTRIVTLVTKDEAEAIVEDGQPWPQWAECEVVVPDDE